MLPGSSYLNIFSKHRRFESKQGWTKPCETWTLDFLKTFLSFMTLWLASIYYVHVKLKFYLIKCGREPHWAARFAGHIWAPWRRSRVTDHVCCSQVGFVIASGSKPRKVSTCPSLDLIWVEMNDGIFGCHCHALGSVSGKTRGWKWFPFSNPHLLRIFPAWLIDWCWKISFISDRLVSL